MKRILVLLTVLATLLMSGCGKGTFEEERVNNVVRVFWHEGNRYSVMAYEPTTNHLKTVSFPQYVCQSGGIELTPDVPASGQMWAQSKIKYGSFSEPSPCIVSLKIHIHSEKDVEGGGWNHGKFGSGQTTVIQ